MTIVFVIFPVANVILILVAVASESRIKGIFEVSGVELKQLAILYEVELSNPILIVSSPLTRINVSICEVEYP